MEEEREEDGEKNESLGTLADFHLLTEVVHQFFVLLYNFHQFKKSEQSNDFVDLAQSGEPR